MKKINIFINGFLVYRRLLPYLTKQELIDFFSEDPEMLIHLDDKKIINIRFLDEGLNIITLL